MQYSNLPADGASIQTTEDTMTRCESEWTVKVHFESQCVEESNKIGQKGIH